jgi:hypothetical protein
VLWVPVVKKLLTPLVALSTGCLPFVVPPLKLSGGAGPATGEVERGTGDLEARSVTTLRAGFHPLSMMPKASSSRFDAGVGYGGDLVFGHAPPPQHGRTSAHGPYLEGAYYPVRLPAGRATFRWGARANADLLFLPPRDVMGWGGTLVTELELGGHSDGAFANADEDGAVFGTSFGSWSIGAFAGGSTRSFPASSYQGFTAGLSARLPFMAGIVCCAWPGTSDDDGNSGSSSSSKRASFRLPKRRHETRPATPVRSSSPPSRPERIPTPKRDELKR